MRPAPDSDSSNPENSDSVRVPALCPDFLIETYLDHQGEQFCFKYDANSLIYVSKAMDLFDMTYSALASLRLQPSTKTNTNSNIETLSRDLPPALPRQTQVQTPHRSPPHLTDLAQGLTPLANTPTLVLGVQSDILFPVEQQREVADALRMAGNKEVSYYELGGVWGHDTFLWVDPFACSRDSD
jgi:homoserine acetyltransferase